jgi:hypothetical protein
MRKTEIALTLCDLDIETLEVNIDLSAVLSECSADQLAETIDDGTMSELVGCYLTDLDSTEVRSLLTDCGHDWMAPRRSPEIEFRGTHLPHVTGIYVHDEVQGVVITTDDGAYLQLWSGTSYAVPLTRYGTESEAHRIARWLVLGQWAQQEVL